MIFLTHPHHRYTQRFDWLWQGLGKPETVLYGDRATLEAFLPGLVNHPPRLLVLYQLEHLAPWCAQFCPVMLFPMLDCTRTTPDSFLRSLHPVELISFSRSLHQRLATLGLSSRYFQYAPDPAEFSPVAWDRGMRGYFWERTPEHLDQSAAEKIFRSLGMDQFEIRRLEDQGFSETKSAETRHQAEKAWQNHEAYIQRIRTFQVYLAPRRFEGIGMTFLEAMAMGMCVVAENQPTADEYITSGVNGILYQGDDVQLLLPPRFVAADLERMGHAAREQIGRLHREWRENRPAIGAHAQQLMARAFQRKPSPLSGLLKATLEFSENPEPLRALVSCRPELIYRSTRQQSSWGTLWGRIRMFLQRPRQFLLRLLLRPK